MSSTGAPQENYTVILFTYKNIKVDTLEQESNKSYFFRTILYKAKLYIYSMCKSTYTLLKV